MFSLEHRVPPPVVMVACGFLTWLLARAAPTLHVSVPAGTAVALLLGAAGIVVNAMGILAFRKARTTLDPFQPGTASTVVDSGIFRMTRNPMYLGLLLLLSGWAVYLSNYLGVLGPVAYVVYMNRFQIGPEERALAEKFGESYTAYRAQVRRWM